MAEEEDNECQQLVKRPKVSSNDMKSTEEECYRKDSFDRYGDDLCEVILSHLSLDDCFRFECLSKQWKRSVFAKRHTLVVDNKLLRKWGVIDNSKMRDINMKALMSVTNKCANITSIQMTITSKATEVVFIVLMSLTSHSLNAIDVRFSDEIDVSIVDTILGEYGSLFTSISLPESAVNVLKLHNKSYTRLRHLSNTSLTEFPLSILFNEDNELIVKSLTQFECDYMEEDLPLFTTFADHYRHSLQSYDVSCEEPTEQLNVKYRFTKHPLIVSNK
ncbi:unnamed protein product [Oppiella nova]|uniref:F-box domain-containing protein n=1 Tax=Oppiella nova TaxID=334625 RepID=A0A7R9MDG5_9ACAR|nr:unnamed protein product [Oppiella nova]CAG2175202.1 unnamed protein product [Oppiella nova]